MKRIIAILLLLVSTAEAQLGRKETRTLTITPAVTAGAYSANDVVGGLLTFSNAFPTISKKGRVTTVAVFDDAGQTASYELFLFKSLPATITDNAAWAPSKANLLESRSWTNLATTDKFAAGTRSVTPLQSMNAFIESDSTTLYGYLVDLTGRTGASVSDITIIVVIEID